MGGGLGGFGGLMKGFGGPDVVEVQDVTVVQENTYVDVDNTTYIDDNTTVLISKLGLRIGVSLVPEVDIFDYCFLLLVEDA
jgi:hypothetical protein